MLTFKTVTAAYVKLLEQHPGKALRIDSANIAFFLDGSLVGFCDADSVLDEGLIYDFDSSSWDDQNGCWAGAGEETQAAINLPEFIDLPVFH